VELVAALLALHPRQGVCAGMHDRVADGTVLHTLQMLVHIALPQQQRVDDESILRA